MAETTSKCREGLRTPPPLSGSSTDPSPLTGVPPPRGHLVHSAPNASCTRQGAHQKGAPKGYLSNTRARTSLGRLRPQPTTPPPAYPQVEPATRRICSDNALYSTPPFPPSQLRAPFLDRPTRQAGSALEQRPDLTSATLETPRGQIHSLTASTKISINPTWPATAEPQKSRCRSSSSEGSSRTTTVCGMSSAVLARWSP